MTDQTKTTPVRTTVDYADYRWQDQHWAASRYIAAFGRVPTEQQVDVITKTVKKERVWQQAISQWKAQASDPADVDGLVKRYWTLHLDGKLTIDAVRLVRLNRTLAALPDLHDTIRMLETCQSDDTDHALNDTKRLAWLLLVHNHEGWIEHGGAALEAVFLFMLYDEKPMRTLAGLLLCQTVRQHPTILTDALAHLQQSLLL